MFNNPKINQYKINYAYKQSKYQKAYFHCKSYQEYTGTDSINTGTKQDFLTNDAQIYLLNLNITNILTLHKFLGYV